MTTQFSDAAALGRGPIHSSAFAEPPYGPPRPNDRVADQDDSEAETERMHDSPTKKRLAEELSIEESQKRVKLAGRDRPDAAPVANAPNSAQETKELEQLLSPRTAKRRAAAAAAAKEEMPTDVSEAENEAENDSEDDLARETGAENEDHNQSPETETNEDRIKAIEALADIEVAFSRVRNRLHDQQLARFDLEIMMCADGTHPELQHYHDRITSECDDRLKRVRSLLCYQMQSIYAQSRASRCSAVQTYLKNRFQLRTEMLNAVTHKWYQANREKQASLAVAPEFGYVATGVPHNVRRKPVKKTGVKTHARLLNMPAAPKMPRLTDSEQDEDLHSLGLL